MIEKAIISRIDFCILEMGVVVVTKFQKVNGRGICPQGPETKPAGFDLEGALTWCEQNGFTVRRWPGGARAWLGKPWPIRTRNQIQRMRHKIGRLTAARAFGDENMLGLDFAFDF